MKSEDSQEFNFDWYQKFDDDEEVEVDGRFMDQYVQDQEAARQQQMNYGTRKGWLQVAMLFAVVCGGLALLVYALAASLQSVAPGIFAQNPWPASLLILGAISMALFGTSHLMTQVTIEVAQQGASTAHRKVNPGTRPAHRPRSGAFHSSSERAERRSARPGSFNEHAGYASGESAASVRQPIRAGGGAASRETVLKRGREGWAATEPDDFAPLRGKGWVSVDEKV